MSNKQSEKVYISFLPLLILILLALGAGYFLLKDEINLKNFFKNEPQIRRIEGYPTVVYTDAPIEKQRRIIKSEDELIDFLKTVDPSGNLTVGEKFNFEKEWLLGVSTPTYQTEGYSMKVKKIYVNEEGTEYNVELRQKELGDNCPKETASNIAIDIVAIPVTDNEIKFDVVKEVNELCRD